MVARGNSYFALFWVFGVALNGHCLAYLDLKRDSRFSFPRSKVADCSPWEGRSSLYVTVAQTEMYHVRVRRENGAAFPISIKQWSQGHDRWCIPSVFQALSLLPHPYYASGGAHICILSIKDLRVQVDLSVSRWV